MRASRSLSLLTGPSGAVEMITDHINPPNFPCPRGSCPQQPGRGLRGHGSRRRALAHPPPKGSSLDAAERGKIEAPLSRSRIWTAGAVRTGSSIFVFV